MTFTTAWKKFVSKTIPILCEDVFSKKRTFPLCIIIYTKCNESYIFYKI